MDKLNFVRDGGRKLPPGFRFEPTDEEIVFQYLSRKTFSHPLPALVIPEFDVFSLDPWNLPGDHELEQDMYFFSNMHGYEEQSKRATPSGFWKATSSSKQINSSKQTPILGIKNFLVFYTYSAKKNNLRAVRTDWTMHQYYLVLSQHTSTSTQNNNNSLIRIGDWSLCHIVLKENLKRTRVNEMSTVDMNMMSDADSCSASSSSPDYDPNIFNEVSSSTRII